MQRERSCPRRKPHYVNRKTIRRLGTLCIISLIVGLTTLVSCGGKTSQSVLEESSSVSPEPVAQAVIATPLYSSLISPLPTFTLSPAKAPSPTATNTSAPNPSPTPSPTSTPTPTYPPYTDTPFRMVFLREGNLWLSEIGGRGEHQLTTEDPEWSISHYAVSPDCNRIAYIPYRRDTLDAAIKQVSVSDGTVSVLTGLDDQFSENRVRWLNDDQILFYIQDRIVKDHSRLAPYTNEIMFYPIIFDLSADEHTVVEGYAFWQSPDNRYQVTCFACAQGYAYECGCAYRLHNVETGEKWHVAEDVNWGKFLGWSSNSEWLLFSTNPSRSSSATELIIVNAATRTTRTITPNDKTALLPNWSPDKDTIAFTLCDRRKSQDSDAPLKNCDLWLVDKDGSNAHLILDGAHGQNIATGSWSPDGQVIAFAQCDVGESIYTISGNCDLGLVNRDGSNPSIISSNIPVETKKIDWLPDSSRLVLVGCPGNADVAPDVWSVRVDGTDLRPVIMNAHNAQILCEP